MRCSNVFFIFFLSTIFSQSGQEIAQRMSDQETPDDVKSELIMILEDKHGNKMESIIKSHTKDGGQKQIMWFLSPPSDRGISLYKIEKENGKDEMKMWLPAFKKVRKISSRKKSESFMNSDLTFEDLYRKKVENYTYNLEFSEDSLSYILTSFPKEDIESSYSKHVTWVEISTLRIKREQSFGKSGALTNTKTFKFVNINGFDIVKEIDVIDNKSKHQTHLRFDNIVLNTGLEDSEFHEMNLRRLPINE